MNRLLPYLLATMLSLPPVAYAAGKGTAPAPTWEIVTSTDASDNNREDIGQHENIEILSRDGTLYITVEQPVKVEIYSILGQLITSRQMKPGTVRLTLRQRGVYILKAGSTTRRINI